MAMLQLGPVTSLQTGHGLEPFLFQGGFAVSVLAVKMFIVTLEMCLPSSETPALLLSRSVCFPVNFM